MNHVSQDGCCLLHPIIMQRYRSIYERSDKQSYPACLAAWRLLWNVEIPSTNNKVDSSGSPFTSMSTKSCGEEIRQQSGGGKDDGQQARVSLAKLGICGWIANFYISKNICLITDKADLLKLNRTRIFLFTINLIQWIALNLWSICLINYMNMNIFLIQPD